jgi:hypothetical protein
MKGWGIWLAVTVGLGLGSIVSGDMGTGTLAAALAPVGLGCKLLSAWLL